MFSVSMRRIQVDAWTWNVWAVRGSGKPLCSCELKFTSCSRRQKDDAISFLCNPNEDYRISLDGACRRSTLFSRHNLEMFGMAVYKLFFFYLCGSYPLELAR